MSSNAPVGQPGTGTARGLWFTAARQAELIEEPVKKPSGAEVTVRAIASLVSAGTEMLVYRGELPAEDDLGLETCAGSFGFPVKYAYQVVGEVIEAGPDARFKLGQKIFVRHPHQDLFTVRSDSWLVAPVPEGLPAERAVFVNLLEVALNCHLDVPVRFGDVVVDLRPGSRGQPRRSARAKNGGQGHRRRPDRRPQGSGAQLGRRRRLGAGGRGRRNRHSERGARRRHLH